MSRIFPPSEEEKENATWVYVASRYHILDTDCTDGCILRVQVSNYYEDKYTDLGWIYNHWLSFSREDMFLDYASALERATEILDDRVLELEKEIRRIHNIGFGVRELKVPDYDNQ